MNDSTDAEDDEIIDPREEIARLEARVEELADNLERSRKFDLAAKILIAGGVAWLLAGAFGLVGLGATTLLGSIAATLGGIVLIGSNGSSMQQIKSAIEAAEARRAALIGAIDLHTVDAAAPQDSPRWLH